MRRRPALTEGGRLPAASYAALERLRESGMIAVPVTGRPGRASDLAIDYCENVPPLADATVQRIAELFRAADATGKINSNNGNGWFGAFDKLAMTRVLFADLSAWTSTQFGTPVVFVGESPTDPPASFFTVSFGMANVRDIAARLAAEPTFMTQARSKVSFVELADPLLARR